MDLEVLGFLANYLTSFPSFFPPYSIGQSESCTVDSMSHSLLIQQFRFSDSHIQMFPALLGNQNNHSLTPRPHLRLLEVLFPDFSTNHLPTLRANLKSKMMRR